MLRIYGVLNTDTSKCMIVCSSQMQCTLTDRPPNIRRVHMNGNQITNVKYEKLLGVRI